MILSKTKIPTGLQRGSAKIPGILSQIARFPLTLAGTEGYIWDVGERIAERNVEHNGHVETGAMAIHSLSQVAAILGRDRREVRTVVTLYRMGSRVGATIALTDKDLKRLKSIFKDYDIADKALAIKEPVAKAS